MLRNTSNFILPVSSRLSTRFASTKIDPRVNISGTFEAQTRTYEESGSKKSRNFRSNGLIPGVLYGIDDDRKVLKTLVTVPKSRILAEIARKGRAFENTVYELHINHTDGTVDKHLITPRQTQFCAVSGQPLSVNFLRYVPGNIMNIPIRYTDEDLSIDLKRGCYNYRVKKFIPAVCDEKVPEYLDMSLKTAKKGDVFRVRDLEFPENVRPAVGVDVDSVVSLIKTPRGK